MTAPSSYLDDEAVHRLVEALTESGQAICLYDAEDRLRYANKRYRSLFMGDYEGPLTFAQILRHADRNGLGVRIDDDIESFIARTLSRRRSVPRKAFETDLVNGRWFWMDHTILPNGWVLSVGADITDLKHNEKTLRKAHEEALAAARTDQLTGLPNRRHILDLLDGALAAAKTAGSSLCVAVIDLDGFKTINDTYGHDAGDAVLHHFAAVCPVRVRPEDRLGRIGGEEFLLLLPEVRLNEAVRIVERIREAFPPALLRNGGPELPYTFSAGVTEALPHDDRSSIIYRADRALYAAKGEGRNCTRIGFEEATRPGAQRYT
jgi:diguanylate cyclase